MMKISANNVYYTPKYPVVSAKGKPMSEAASEMHAQSAPTLDALSSNISETTVTVTLPLSTLAQLQTIAETRGISASAALKQVIADQAFLEDLVRNGNQVMIARPNGKLDLWNLKKRG